MKKDNEFGIQHLPPIQKPVLHKDKYWGYITSVFADDDFALKKIFMKKGSQSSMEYHCNKDEFYYIFSGKLKVGHRIGRAENTRGKRRIPHTSWTNAYENSPRGYYYY